MTLTLIFARFIFPKRWRKTHNVWIIYTSIWRFIVNTLSVILKRWILMRKCRSLVRLVQNINRSMYPKRWKCYCTSKMNNKETFLPVKIAVTAFRISIHELRYSSLPYSLPSSNEGTSMKEPNPNTANIFTRSFHKLKKKKQTSAILQYPSNARQSMIYGRLKEWQDIALYFLI